MKVLGTFLFEGNEKTINLYKGVSVVFYITVEGKIIKWFIIEKAALSYCKNHLNGFKLLN